MRTREELKTQVFVHFILCILAICALLPFLLLIISSLTDNASAVVNGYSFFPEKWSLEAYEYIWRERGIIGNAFMISIIVTFTGTIIMLIITSMLAYALACQDLPGVKMIMFMVVFTMLFNGGIVSTYFIYANMLHIKNTIWALIVPGLLLNAFNVILVKNYYMNSISPALLEAARIDGAGEFKIFFRIVLPLSPPILATVGLMGAISYWNDWTNGLYYLNERDGAHLYNIQNIMNKISENINFLANNSLQMGTVDTSVLPSTTIRMAIAVVGILPILIAFPFFQKYLVKGITIGGVKE